ncbi:hypothetical protein GPECTOR_2g1289 [Gonium pectorale]|uniref:Protein kinase domain-containing protein n=1 Tax=Gonium pectorale TaxID=33097 RepID=A0A150H0T9_GONPE|nr:hypothetical protein GPECTOR_2g1289 [Gonium pectorale]|eukprot:KXZ55739.1 hypothetical protein GPECTOR_2g1289 [Gonium pectorale]
MKRRAWGLECYFLNKVPANVVHMIVREIKVGASFLQIHTDLVHDNIVMLYAAFQTRLVLVQEYAARGDLYHISRALPARTMTEEQVACLVLKPFLDGLAYLHARGICHR